MLNLHLHGVRPHAVVRYLLSGNVFRQRERACLKAHLRSCRKAIRENSKHNIYYRAISIV